MAGVKWSGVERIREERSGVEWRGVARRGAEWSGVERKGSAVEWGCKKSLVQAASDSLRDEVQG